MGMREPRYNLGRATWIGAEALGLPGQRTFRLLVQTHSASAQLWLEKEQLQALAQAIARMLLEINSEREKDFLASAATVTVPRPPDFPATPEIELNVGALGLRYDPQRDLIALEAFDRDAEEEEGATFRCLASREQMESLEVNSLEVASAGRPLCPLCGAPLSEAGMPHFCPRTNGHQKLEGETTE